MRHLPHREKKEEEDEEGKEKEEMCYYALGEKTRRSKPINASSTRGREKGRGNVSFGFSRKDKGDHSQVRHPPPWEGKDEEEEEKEMCHFAFGEEA